MGIRVSKQAASEYPINPEQQLRLRGVEPHPKSARPQWIWHWQIVHPKGYEHLPFRTYTPATYPGPVNQRTNAFKLVTALAGDPPDELDLDTLVGRTIYARLEVGPVQKARGGAMRRIHSVLDSDSSGWIKLYYPNTAKRFLKPREKEGGSEE